MTLFFRASSHIGLVVVVLFLSMFLAGSPPFLFAGEGRGDVTVVSVGLGPPPARKTAPDKEGRIPTAVDDAEKKAVLTLIYDALGEGEFFRLEDALDTLILPEYTKYIKETEIVSTSPFPDADTVIVKARVTLDGAPLSRYLDNIIRLTARPEGPKALSSAQKEILIKKAEAIFIQGEVASDILLDRIRGIESYLSAKNIFETAEYDEGVYRCLMGLCRARISLGDAAGAADDIEAADKLSRTLGRPEYSAEVGLARARLLLFMGDTGGAEKEAARVLEGVSVQDTERLIGDLLLLCAEIDLTRKQDKEGESKIRQAIAILERSADVRRLGQAYLTLGLILTRERDFSGAVAAFKIARNLAERQGDGVAKVTALIGIGRTLRASGDPGAASPYLRDALLVAGDLGWILGETAAHCETARVLLDTGDLAGAEREVVLAHTLAFSTTSPSLCSAALFAEGEVSLAAEKKGKAFEAFSSYTETSSDIRVSDIGLPSLPLGNDRTDPAVGILLSLSIELGEEKSALSSLLAAEGALISRRLTYTPPVLPKEEERLIGRWKDAATSAIAAERAFLSGDFVRLAETSRAEIIRRRDEADLTLSEITAEISARSPALSALMGIDPADAGDFARVLPEDAAFVHYFLGDDAAFGLVVTKRGASVVRLGDAREEIADLARDLKSEIAPAPAPVPLPEGSTGAAVVPFARTSERLYSLLISPLLPRLAGVTTLGISPGIALESLPLNALGHFSGDGAFVLLPEEYTVFTASCLFPRLAVVSPEPLPMGSVTVVGDGGIADDRLLALFPDVRAIPDGNDAVDKGEGGGKKTLLILSGAGSYPWWEEDAPLVVVPNLDEKFGLGPFLGTEYLAFMKDTTFLLIPKDSGPDEASAFLTQMIEASGGTQILRGYAETVRGLAEGVRSGGPVDWIPVMLISDFVSKQR